MGLSDNFDIAEFLGGEVKPAYIIQGKPEYMWYGEIAHEWRREKLGIKIGECLLESHLEFHKSWDWLMPVIDKIESMGYTFNINKCFVNIVSKDNKILCCYQIGHRDTQDTKFLALYKAVVSFIRSQEFAKKHL